MCRLNQGVPAKAQKVGGRARPAPTARGLGRPVRPYAHYIYTGKCP